MLKGKFTFLQDFEFDSGYKKVGDFEVCLTFSFIKGCAYNLERISNAYWKFKGIEFRVPRKFIKRYLKPYEGEFTGDDAIKQNGIVITSYREL